MSTEEEPQMIWVRTGPDVDGTTYVISVEFSDDQARVLNPVDAVEYATTVLAAAERAAYDAAVYAQIRALVPDPGAVAQMIRDLRNDRPPLNPHDTAPLRLEPGVNSAGEPFLALFLDDNQFGQWTVAAARDHAMGVLGASIAADLDAAYHRALVGIIGLESERARMVVADLVGWRRERQ